jgi:hypothetical protein
MSIFVRLGVGVIYRYTGVAVGPVVGTSFTGPLAAATAALILQRDSQYMNLVMGYQGLAQYERPMEVLRTVAKSFGPAGVDCVSFVRRPPASECSSGASTLVSEGGAVQR